MSQTRCREQCTTGKRRLSSLFIYKDFLGLNFNSLFIMLNLICSQKRNSLYTNLGLIRLTPSPTTNGPLRDEKSSFVHWPTRVSLPSTTRNRRRGRRWTRNTFHPCRHNCLDVDESLTFDPLLSLAPSFNGSLFLLPSRSRNKHLLLLMCKFGPELFLPVSDIRVFYLRVCGIMVYKFSIFQS